MLALQSTLSGTHYYLIKLYGENTKGLLATYAVAGKTNITTTYLFNLTVQLLT